MDLRDEHPDHTPPQGWAVSEPRHPDGWVAKWLEYLNVNGLAEYDPIAGVLTIQRINGESLSRHWRISVTEGVLEKHLTSFLDRDGTVCGLDDPDEPVATDGMVAAWQLFMVHVEEEVQREDGQRGYRRELLPGVGLRPA